jgi:transcription-repair coupling factor (superfamily II helicase)
MDLSKDKVVAELISRLEAAKPAEGALKAEGTWGSYAPVLAAHISQRLKRPILYICPHIDDADNVGDDLQVFTGTTVETFPAWESEPSFADATDEIAAERLRVAMQLASTEAGAESELIISTSVLALCQPVPRPSSLEANCFIIEASKPTSPEELVAWLADNAFERVDRVDLPGQFAQRGGIVDIYAPMVGRRVMAAKTGGQAQSSQAVRVEFFGDVVESMRTIDLDTQRSSEHLHRIDLIPPVTSKLGGETGLFINLLPADTIVILEEPADIQEVARVFLDRVENPAGLYSWHTIHEAMGRFTQLHICRFAGVDKDQFLKLDVKSAQQFEHKAGPLWAGNKAAIDELLQQAAEGKDVLLYCETAAEVKRITEIVGETHKEIPSNFSMPLGFIHQGFIINSLNTIVVSHHEIFGQYAVRRRIRAVRTTSAVETFLDLEPGDYVVHISHGIGKFRGIKTFEKNGSLSEYLSIEYADKAMIHVPVQNIAFVQKYVGTMQRRPRLSTIGSKKWLHQKEKVEKAVEDLASELIEIQARRHAIGGIAFGPDSTWHKEFEESFLYQETPDQITASEQIKADMQQPVPMDRLLCGDVGYGKTELAMRAAFKAVENGKQVAVLVPTTVLCIQHGRTFTERFADFPFVIEILNRFKTPAEAKDIVRRTKQGKVDILIGTHRILSDDVGFKDLGLVIIDEEQRFGVEHKEKLKKLRVNIDVLTMTATPIPRTLHLSLLGLRDISSLTTPPLDRRSITTTVCRYDKELLRKAVIREMNRQGQVFFLHNRVHSIHKMADEVQAVMPDARIAIGHGQMAKHELEQTMMDFVMGKVDVLVCTTIIESGLDIPNANTILINNADRFGLAELHQLRGRVGRYKHRAFAYMFLPQSRPITPIAAKRLKAIEEYSELGAGFRIALRDLEIRGAGNILGAEQSGHIHTVGYEMYCKLLSDAVKRLRNEPIEQPPRVIIDLGFTTYIPKSYIPSDRQRMDVYRRIAVAAGGEDLKRLRSDLADLFGPVPPDVELLLDFADLRIKADCKHIKSILASGNDLIFSFENTQAVGNLFAKAPGIVRIPDPKTVYVRLEKNYFEPRTLISILRKILK